tara:strand:+ start:604 stop:1698 length:1095 start_codon:yes stop_codon:yes gene_type:complete
MVLYECFRCGYSTNLKGNMNHHLNRKNVCKPLLEDIDIIDVKMYYGFKLQTKKKPKITSIETKCETTTTDSSSEYSDISDTESDDTTFLPQNTTNYHQNTTNCHQNPPKSTKIPPKSTTLLPQNTTNLPQKTTLLPQNTTKINQCKYCNKILSRYDSLSRHMKTCKEKKEVELTMIQNEEMIKIKKESEDMKKEIEELKNFKIQTQNNITNNHNNSHNKTNNIIINNYGDEDLKHLRTRDFKKLLNGIYSAVPKLIEKIHFDPEHPENQNIKYPNMNKPFLKIMKDDKWQFVNKTDELLDLIDAKCFMLKDKYYEILEKKKYNITDTQRDKIEEFMKKYHEEERETTKELLKRTELILLNNKNI